MDTVITSLPPKVGAILMENISIIQVVSMFSIGAYNALEIGIVTFDTFKHYRSLYFWSMQIASWGILVHALPAMARFVSQASNLATSIPFIIGWYAMVTGQAVVLYSRLHFLISNMRKMRWVLWMIVINFCILHIPMTVLFFGVNNGDTSFARPAAIFDRIQLTGFCIQDFAICGIYIYEAIRAFKKISTIRGRNSRSAIIHLLCINILVVLLNVLLLLAEYKLHYIQVSFKTVVYSIKLKLEFSVLNRLSLAVLPCTCKRGSREPSRSSDQIIFNKSLPRPPVGPEMALQPTIAPGEISRRSLLPGCVDGHQTVLREMPSESIISPGDISYSGTLPESHSSTHSTGSSEYLPALELSLSEFSPKFDV
ncbi:unnamed protein product [Penicillium nalgiovense]|uniref:DUF7703 domain-containing protein n=1 Tax=Penicillium nalgiovense TaxID=60175 RepID=A0A9W4HZ25_PENNA|nr:unnamed protein product [Penicillium nalgiovense]CAG8094707.1 unnamed protein product [Penicillium nalgiovense]CAG8112230.1 unnamed protein product [Penicillium nalgiovense]CAG8127315.1 unnamed protein product [Penicillium nalgiovense]CAG8127932.1 unnamed protein product [Penicillium nalgiovense]